MLSFCPARWLLATALVVCTSAPAAAQVSNLDEVRLIMRTDDARARLYVAPEGAKAADDELPRSAVPLCAAPCMVSLPPARRWFFAGGEGLSTSKPFSLSNRRGDVELDVTGTSTSSRAAGVVMLATGLVLLGSGAVVAGVSVTERESAATIPAGPSLGGVTNPIEGNEFGTPPARRPPPPPPPTLSSSEGSRAS